MLPIKHSNFNVNNNYTIDLINLRLDTIDILISPLKLIFKK